MLSNDSSIKIINRNSNRGEPSKKMNKDEDHNDSIEILYQTTNEQCVRELKVLLFVESVAVRIYTMDVSYLCNEYDIITTIFPFYEIYKDELGYRVVENGTLKRIELNAVRDPKCSYQYIIKIETVSKERKPLKFFGDFYVREEVQTKQPFQCLTPKSVDLQEPYFEEEQLDLHKSRETKTTRLYPSIIENNEQKSSSPSQKPVELSDSPILTRDNLPMHSKSSKDTILAVYPPPPERGGITIYKENYKCLGDSEYLNDVVIDFYLKYLTNEILKKEDRNRTHIFSSQFFTRLSKPPDTNKDAKVVIPESERRHIGVQRWTKNINIFEKDFVIIPINEHFHWYLAIICYAHLVDVINNYSQTLIRPCILFFDSLSNKNKDRIAAILRGYLSQEYLAKMGKQKNFSSNTLKIIYPRIPKQSNATDCGLYVLQYVEQFFKDPIMDFTEPLDLSQWFKCNIIKRKRAQIASLIAELSKIYNSNKTVSMPLLYFPSDSIFSDEEKNDDLYYRPIKRKKPLYKDNYEGFTTDNKTNSVSMKCSSVVLKKKNNKQSDFDKSIDSVRDKLSPNDELDLSIEFCNFSNNKTSENQVNRNDYLINSEEDNVIIEEQNIPVEIDDKSLEIISDVQLSKDSFSLLKSIDHNYLYKHKKISLTQENFSDSENYVFQKTNILSDKIGEQSSNGIHPKHYCHIKERSKKMVELVNKFQEQKINKLKMKKYGNEEHKKSNKWIDTFDFNSSKPNSLYNVDEERGIPPSISYATFKIQKKQSEALKQLLSTKMADDSIDC